jgi:hypothetical protein
MFLSLFSEMLYAIRALAQEAKFICSVALIWAGVTALLYLALVE